jgi:hypothetical protein
MAGNPDSRKFLEEIPSGAEITLKLDNGTEVEGILKGIQGRSRSWSRAATRSSRSITSRWP